MQVLADALDFLGQQPPADLARGTVAELRKGADDADYTFRLEGGHVWYPRAWLRHDSGDPVVWGEKALAHYERLRIDPHTKRLVFSDGLDIATALRLYRHFADRTQLGFGIGTHLSNDMGLQTLHIVMKLTRVNGQPVAKLSDSPGKTMCDDETFLAYLRQVFGVRAPARDPAAPA